MLEKIWDQQLWDRQPQLRPPLTPHHATKFNVAVTQKGKSWGFVLGDVWHSLYSYFDRLRQVAPELCKKKQ